MLSPGTDVGGWANDRVIVVIAPATHATDDAARVERGLVVPLNRFRALACTLASVKARVNDLIE